MHTCKAEGQQEHLPPEVFFFAVRVKTLFCYTVLQQVRPGISEKNYLFALILHKMFYTHLGGTMGAYSSPHIL